MTLLQRLEGSFTVQEQEAGERLRELYSALATIRKVAEADLFDACESIIEIIDMVVEDGDDE